MIYVKLDGIDNEIDSQLAHQSGVVAIAALASPLQY